MFRFFGVMTLAMASAAGAQVVGECVPELAQARSLAEPWEANTLMLEGDIRLAIVDTIEPGAVPYHLMILTPPFDELGARICQLVSLSADVFGFSSLTLEGLATATDAAGRLVVTLQAGVYNDQTGATDPAVLRVVIDPAKGAVTAQMQ